MFSSPVVRNASLCVFTILLGLLAAAPPAGAQTSSNTNCNFPLFIQQSGVEANVIFIFDNSRSMSTPLYHPDYDVFTTYTGDFRSTGNYYVSSDGYYEPSDFDSNWPRSPSAYLVQSSAGDDGIYPGNYLNWVYYHATDAQRKAIPQTTRMIVAKAAVTSLVGVTNGVRFGTWKFDDNDGGVLVTRLTTDKTQVISDINGIRADLWTPLAETLEDVLDYLKDSDSDAIQFECQKTFVIIVTDGYPTNDRSISNYLHDYDNDGNDPGSCSQMGSPDPDSYECSDYLDDVALYLYDNDLSSLDGKQNATTYTIGFNLDASILQDTADNGGGLYFNANDADELQKSLESVLSDIISKLSAGTAVAVVSAENADHDRIFRAKFEPGTWLGSLEAFDLPYNNGDVPIWDAADMLKSRSPDSRVIYARPGNNTISFETGNVSDLEGPLGAADTDEALEIIRWTRGEDFAPHRDRNDYKLGDIVNSSPVIVGKPSHFFDFLDYTAFRSSNANRDKMLYVGANDGMLHAFSAVDGSERWAYIPAANMSSLKSLMDRDYCHEFTSNATPRAFDAFVNGQWRTLLIAGQREGGNSFVCLDVTNPRQMSVLWDRAFPEVVQSWSVPEIVRDRDRDEFVAVVGSGPDPAGNARMLVLSLSNGSILHEEFLSSKSGVNMASDAVSLDRDFDGYHDLLYMSDLAGHVHRFDMSSFPWSKSTLFETSQPIQARPVLTIDKYDNVLLYFGTGKYVESSDISDTSQQSFYSIIDNHSTSAIVTRSMLVDQTSSVTPLGSNDRGWVLDLVQAPGERVTRPDALAAGVVFFSSFKPTTMTCEAGGQSWLYRLDFEDGSNPDEKDGTEDDGTDERVESIGDGILSEPILDLTNEDIILQSTDTGLFIRDTNANIQRVVIRSWRELFN